LPVCLDEDDPIRMQASLRESRKEQVRPHQAPNDLASCPRRDAGDKERSRSTIDDARSAASELMHRTMGKSPARQYGIDLRHTEGKTVPLPARAPLQ